MTVSVARTPLDRPAAGPEVTDAARFALFALPIVAALGPYASLEPVEGSPYYAFRLLCIILVVPAISAWAAARAVGSPAAKAFAVLVGAWAIWAPAGLLWSQDPGPAYREVLTVSLALAGGFAAVFLSGGTAAGVRALHAGWIGAFVVTGLCSCWELVTGQHLAGNARLGLYTNSYAASTFFNTNDYAGFLLACLPFLACAAAQAGFTLRRLVAAGLLVGWVILAFATLSRTAVLGMLCTIPPLVYWYVKATAINRPEKSFRLARAAVIAGVALLAMVASAPGRELLGNLRSPFGLDGGASRSDATRFHLTRLGWQFFVDSGLIGRGAGTFEASVAVDPSSNYYAQVTNAHNGFIEIAAQYGIVIVAPLLFAFFAVLRSALPTAGDDRASAVLLHQRMAVLLGVMAFTASSLASSSVIASAWWWVLFGTLVAQSWRLHRMRRE